jgi:hypothetical protein
MFTLRGFIHVTRFGEVLHHHPLGIAKQNDRIASINHEDTNVSLGEDHEFQILHIIEV